MLILRSNKPSEKIIKKKKEIAIETQTEIVERAVEAEVQLEEDLIKQFGESHLAALENKENYLMVRQFNREANYKPPPIIATSEAYQFELLRCKYDILYYLENYCYIPIPGGSTKIYLSDKLRTVARLFEASVLFLFMTSRQSSKTTLILACKAWYFNFWENTSSVLINLTVPDNKKNISIIKNILRNNKLFLRVWNPEQNKKDIDNTSEILVDATQSKLIGLVINKQDPDSTGRGKSGSL